MDAPVADAGLGVGVREQPVQPGAAAALALTDPLGGLRLGLAEGGVDQRVERGVGHALLDQPLGLDLERVYVGEGQSERLAGGLDGGIGVAGVADRERRLVVAQRALWVFAHTTGTGVTRMRNALVPS